MDTKHCAKCQTTKSVIDFAKNRARKDGLQTYCKPCGVVASKKYAQSHRAECVERSLRYKAKNPDKVLQMKTRYRLINKKRLNLISNEYRKNNLEMYAEKNRRRTALKRNNGVYKITKKEMAAMYASKCFYCGNGGQIHLDHVIPLIRGGNHSIGNLVPACASCNLSKNAKFITEWKHYLRKLNYERE